MIGKLFWCGRFQAVRLPRGVRFTGERVSLRRAGRGVLIEPIATDVEAWFARMDGLRIGRFMADGRDQPVIKPRGGFGRSKTAWHRRVSR